VSARRSESFESRGHRNLEGSTSAPASDGPAGSRIHNTILMRRPSLMQEPVLVLNATYEPINVTAVRRAMVLMFKGVAQAEELHSAEVHSAAHAHRVPSVIRLLAYRISHSRAGPFPERISCCAIGTPASFAVGFFPARNSRWIMSFRVPVAAVRPGRTWWPAAIAATTARETVPRRRRG